jgi:hypothetical protein
MVKPLDLVSVDVRGRPLVLASHAEVDDLEARLKVRMPEGYREYVTTLGEGSLNTLVRVLPPWRVLSDLEEHRGLMAGFWFWDSGNVAFGQEEAMASIAVADTLDGDVIVFHPSDPGHLIVLPRGGERLYARGPDLLETINWICSGRVLRSLGPSRYFEPFDSRVHPREPTDIAEAAESTARAPDLTQPPRDVLLAYFDELRAVEEYAVGLVGGPNAFSRRDPPDLGEGLFDEVLARTVAVHRRYCTPGLAMALSVGLGARSWPTPHDPASFRILDERQTRPDRTTIATSEAQMGGVQREYVLQRSQGEWRIASEKDVGFMEWSGPAPGGLRSRLKGFFGGDRT